MAARRLMQWESATFTRVHEYAVSLSGRACGFIRRLCTPSCGTDWLDCFWFGSEPWTSAFPDTCFVISPGLGDRV